MLCLMLLERFLIQKPKGWGIRHCQISNSYICMLNPICYCLTQGTKEGEGIALRKPKQLPEHKVYVHVPQRAKITILEAQSFH